MCSERYAKGGIWLKLSTRLRFSGLRSWSTPQARSLSPELSRVIWWSGVQSMIVYLINFYLFLYSNAFCRMLCASSQNIIDTPRCSIFRLRMIWRCLEWIWNPLSNSIKLFDIWAPLATMLGFGFDSVDHSTIYRLRWLVRFFKLSGKHVRKSLYKLSKWYPTGTTCLHSSALIFSLKVRTYSMLCPSVIRDCRKQESVLWVEIVGI